MYIYFVINDTYTMYLQDSGTDLGIKNIMSENCQKFFKSKTRNKTFGMGKNSKSERDGKNFNFKTICEKLGY